MTRPSHNRTRHVASALAVAIVTALARHAHAEEPTLSAGEGVEGCPPAADLRAAIVQNLGRDPFSSASSANVAVQVRRTGEALFAEILVSRAGAAARSRVISGDTCADLVRASALVASLAIEEDEAKAPAPPTEPPVPPAPAPVERDAGPANEGSIRASRFVAVASAMTAIGLLPSPSAGIAGTARVRLSEMVWLSARGLYVTPAAMPDNAFTMNLYGAGAGACVEPFGTKSAALFACGHVVGGALGVDSANRTLANGGSKGFVAASAAVGGRARLAGPVILEGTVETLIPFGHPTFVTADCPVVGFQQPFATLAFSVGAGVSIP